CAVRSHVRATRGSTSDSFELRWSGPATVATRGGPMGIVFFCQSCGARFEVDPRMAGRKGRCRQCGQYTTIPRAEEVASMSAMPALAPAAVAVGRAAPAPAADGTAASIGAWLREGISQIGLAPLTSERLKPARPTRPSALDDAEDSKPYALARPIVDN